ncbi:MAG: PHP domain-containing protein [Anaerolineaceae bacterium]|nr:PHP domain-containing protein [Anaerolineaceae bacterium]MBN2677801.1 PHP domain-containing protein [Anaerolineaceae bacterium]
MEIHIDPSQQGSYFTLPFKVPENISRLSIAYEYSRRPEKDIKIPGGMFTSQMEENVVDLGLIRPDGSQAGVSGSDKLEISISDTFSTQGYQSGPITPGEWNILVGAYKICKQGVTVRYTILLDHKQMILLKGDLHVHSLASDGIHSLEELAIKAKRNGLQFLAITDHNQMVSSVEMPRVPGVTLIPGIEWTHYQGHANFLGIDKPYDEPFVTNTLEEAQKRFNSARQRGALITINHPFEEIASFRFDLDQLPYDCIEIWNGPMRVSNIKAIGLWQKLLVSGRKIPFCAGSDYHRDTPFIFLGGPTMCVTAISDSVSDILDGIRNGHAYATFAPNGPMIELNAGHAIMGDSVPWNENSEITIKAEGLLSGDVLQLITGTNSETLYQVPMDGKLTMNYKIAESGFARVELLRSFLPGLPMLPALLSNPIYFD